MSKRILSAIILTWNLARYIERCLKSLAKGAYKVNLPIEIFVVDGGSTDGTLGILSRLAQEIPGLCTIRLERNFGTTVSRNSAFWSVKGNNGIKIGEVV